MIISKQGNKLVLVRQDEHMVQAGDVARRWGNEKFSRMEKHESVSLGIGLHDFGWKEPDDAVWYNEKTKRPMNFLDVDLPGHVRFYEEGFREALKRDEYAGLMLGLHWIGLYTRRYGYDPTFTYEVPENLTDFFHSVISRIEKEFVDIKNKFWDPRRKRSEFEDQIWMSYEFFQVMDRTSLFMSLNDPMSQNRVVLGPVRKKQQEDPVHITLTARGDGTLLVEPFPFAEEFETFVPARKIEDRDYSSHEEIKEVVEKTEKIPVKWKVVAR